MGLIGRYIDALPGDARDRVITAQDWCVAGVLGPNGSRCLIGHAEDWRELAVGPGAWRSRMAAVTAAGPRPADADLACSEVHFAFRRARPAAMELYRGRVRRWGLASEGRIGARFDRLCARRGIPGAVRLVKARAAGPPPVDRGTPYGFPPPSRSAMRTRSRSSSRSSGTP
jgi:hypothetical protein